MLECVQPWNMGPFDSGQFIRYHIVDTNHRVRVEFIPQPDRQVALLGEQYPCAETGIVMVVCTDRVPYAAQRDEVEYL